MGVWGVQEILIKAAEKGAVKVRAKSDYSCETTASENWLLSPIKELLQGCLKKRMPST